MREILARIMVFEVVFDIFDILLGAGLCFSAIRWRRGLLTATSFLWGIFIGTFIGILIAGIELRTVVLCAMLGGLFFRF